jgi:hypothetical protein
MPQAINLTDTAPIIVLEGKDIYQVAFLESGLSYNLNTKRGKDNKTFSRYQRNNIVFTVNDEHPFNADFKAGQIKSITLVPSKAEIKSVDSEGNELTTERDTLAFSTCINRAQWNAMQEDRLSDAKIDSMIARYQHLATAPVTDALLAELTSSE